jgi:hypothetical protein
MRIGITGHQRLQDASRWEHVRAELRSVIQDLETPLIGVTSLAVGSDQVFAEVVLDLGGSLECIIPFPGYERTFSDERTRAAYFHLLGRAQRKVTLEPGSSDEESFWAAGRRMVDESDCVIAVWDGRPAGGLGGTGDVVAYARERGKKVLRIDPGTAA